MASLIVGGGIFGITAALALRDRGHQVTLVDPGPLPHPLAESTDISKVIRIDYGADEDYMALGERALDGWRRWNRDGTARFHETGVMFVCRSAMAPGGFEHDSFALLQRRGHRPERLDAAAIAHRFPAWRAGVHVDGYFNPAGGWAESGAVVADLVARARAAGVDVRGDCAVSELIERGGRVGGVRAGGVELLADCVVICAGAWSARLVPSLAGSLRAVGQPVFHLRPADADAYRHERFPVFGADIARTGYYGFPSNGDGVVKIANHGVGVQVDPAAAREVAAAQEQALRAFLAEVFPGLADAPIAHRRLCVYCDTADEHFWIAADPDRPGLVVATGGSGHAFKFAPVLGDLVADAAEGAPPALGGKFGWRPGAAARPEEAARHHGDRGRSER